MDTQSSPGVDECSLDKRELDYWGIILDIVPPVLRAWKLILLVTVVAGAIAYFMSPPKTYNSISYAGTFDEARAKYFDSVIRSAPVLDVVLDKFPDYPQSGMLDANRREYLSDHIRFAPAAGSDPKRFSLYILELSGPDASKVQALLSALLDAVLRAAKPKPDAAARLDRLLDATQSQISDLSTVINELLKHPESIVPKPGYFPPNVADMIKLRGESINRLEDIRGSIEGMSRDVIFSDPAAPSLSARPRTLKAVLKAMGITFVALLVIVVLRHIVLRNMSSPHYGSKMKRIREALPWRSTRKNGP